MAEHTDNGGKIAILGCGKLGIAILQGLAKSYSKNSHNLGHVVVTAKTSAGAKRIQKSINGFATTQDSLRVEIHTGDENSLAVQDAVVVILGCKPNALSEILTPKVVRAIEQNEKRTILVNLAGGVTLVDLARMYRSVRGGQEHRAFIVRAIPNIAASVRQSATVLSSWTEDGREAVQRVFDLIGHTEWVAEEQMFAASALGASSLAFHAIILRAVAGSLSEMSSADAIRLCARAMLGTAALVLAGESPDAIIDKVATRGGSTEAGLHILKTHGVEDSFLAAIRATTQATGTMGKTVSRLSDQPGGADVRCAE
ncbi:hypothetical protein PMG11_06582 [Penicillium brasilianum]|uniref:Pyrroline-5-carboxylate reductase n=1 Tax=Penicillium brasilianum TaxID=104259 RepID=A0A0F7TR34_PENBI|nr:hypothetical protein PMG11_06582 [Penicillium brasilianum]